MMGGSLVVVAVVWVSVEDPDVWVSLLAVHVAAVTGVVVAGTTVLCSAAAVAAGGPLGLVAGAAAAAAAACGEGSCLLPPAARDRKLRPDSRSGSLAAAGLDAARLQTG